WEEGLLDYVALDFKGIGQKYHDITVSDTFTTFADSLTLLQKNAIPCEVRTTWHADLLSVEDMETMVTYLERQGYEGKYFVQYFLNAAKTLPPLPHTTARPDPDQLPTEKIKAELRITEPGRPAPGSPIGVKKIPKISPYHDG